MLLAEFALLAGALALAIWGAERLTSLSAVLLRRQDTTDQLRIRGAFVLLAVFTMLAERLGLEVILGAFVAGALLVLVDRDQMVTHPQFRTKLEAIGFGIFVPFFFVASGLRFDLTALATSPATLVRVPLFLAALDVTRSMAQRARATITEVAGSHVTMISQPQVVTEVILNAVAGVGMAAAAGSR